MIGLRQGACNLASVPQMTPAEIRAELDRLANNYGLCEAPYTAAIMRAAVELIGDGL